MILVTLGTQKQQFTRLLEYIEKSNITDEIIVQAGYTKYESKKMNVKTFFNYEEMEKYIDKADIIISHCGTGSIIIPLKKGKKIIACARLEKYGEHIDDHQTQLLEKFTENGYILTLNDDNDLDDIIDSIDKFIPRKYISNTNNFIESLKKII